MITTIISLHFFPFNFIEIAYAKFYLLPLKQFVSNQSSYSLLIFGRDENPVYVSSSL